MYVGIPACSSVWEELVLKYIFIFVIVDSSLLQRSEGLSFQLQHFQGTAPVKYNCEGWLKASRENPTSKCVVSFLQETLPSK